MGTGEFNAGSRFSDNARMQTLLTYISCLSLFNFSVILDELISLRSEILRSSL